MFGMSLKRPVLALLLLLLPVLVFATDGKVTKVKDGDTVVIESTTCRLYGIDAPEKKQPYGPEAKDYLKNLIYRQTVDYQIVDTDRYGRGICRIKKDGQDINLEMVKSGYAWAYVQYLKRPHASEYIDAEKEARNKRLGLWNDVNPTPPWEFRKLQRKRR